MGGEGNPQQPLASRCPQPTMMYRSSSHSPYSVQLLEARKVVTVRGKDKQRVDLLRITLACGEQGAGPVPRSPPDTSPGPTQLYAPGRPAARRT